MAVVSGECVKCGHKVHVQAEDKGKEFKHKYCKPSRVKEKMGWIVIQGGRPSWRRV